MASKVLDIKSRVEVLALRYADRIMLLKNRSTYNLGMRSETLSDVRRTFIAQLRNLSELAVAFGDKEAVDMIAGMVDDGSIAEDLKAIKANANKDL
tara:strand:+ start:82 stop:369 length:288 start_codon:yes stop_codon:yes gene_type:complete